MENIRETLTRYYELYHDYHEDVDALGDEVFSAENDLEELANKIVEHFGIKDDEKQNYSKKLLSIVRLEGLDLDYFINTIIEWFSKNNIEYYFFHFFEIVKIGFNAEESFSFVIQFITCEFDYENDETKETINKEVLVLDYKQAEKLLRNTEYPSYLILDSILQKLKHQTNNYLFEINIEREFGESLFNNTCFVKTICEKGEPHDLFKVTDIYLNPVKNKDRSPFNVFDKLLTLEIIQGKLKDCYKILETAYTMFLQLQDLGIGVTKAREKSGLTDDMLYRIAFYVYRMNHLSNDDGFGDLKEYIRKNASFLINEEELKVILTGFYNAWHDVHYVKFEWFDYYEAIIRYLVRTENLIPSSKIFEILNLIFEYMGENRIIFD